MLKDKFSKFFKPNNKESDSFKLNIMDGFVDIKAYKVDKNGNKKIVYHDCGDNVVTDWMRHAIMMLLTGNSFLNKGNSEPLNDGDGSRASMNSVTTINSLNHASDKNLDGYLLNKEQYLWNDKTICKYSKSNISDDHKYAMFPTKVLFGTGKEYSNWQEFEDENQVANPTWYDEMSKLYGSSNPADLFNKHIKGEGEDLIKCNSYSGTIAKNIYSGSGNIKKTRTVNNSSSIADSNDKPSSMNKNYGVVGAIKTPYFGNKDKDMLVNEPTKGTLLKAEYRGIGRPCFIYFTTEAELSGAAKEAWDSAASDVYLSKNDESKYLNKITFKINMPSQSTAADSLKYYPYNGYTLRQIGLFNDTLLAVDKNDTTSSEARANMPCGMMLAIKNIAALEKIADLEVAMTWTLTI